MKLTVQTKNSRYRPIAAHDHGLKLQTIYELVIEYTDIAHASWRTSE